MKKNSQKRKFGAILLSLAALFAVLFFAAACKTDSDDDELNNVTISLSESTINANGQTSLFAKVDKKGSGNPVYEWTITAGSEYATLDNETSSTCVVTGKNTTASAQSVKIKCTVTFASATKEAEATVTVSAAKAELKSVSIAGSAEIESTANTELTATPAFTVKGVSPAVTYTWTISAGSEYAELSESTTGTVTLTGKNTDTVEHEVTVKVTATYDGTAKEATTTVKILAAGQVVENKVTSVSVSAGKDSIACDGSTTLTAKAEYSGNPEITYTWTITAGGDYAELSESTTGTVTLTGKNTDTAEQTVTVKVTASDGTNSVENTCTVTVKSMVSVTPDITIVPGASVTTYGWADVGGMSYPDTTNIIYICDDGYKVGSGSLTSYTSSQTKRVIFTNAIASGSVSSSTVNTISAIIILSGTVDLSDGVISDTDHSYYESFDSSTHKRNHEDITYEIGSNKAIIGVNSAKVAFGGLKIYANKCERGNIIIRNIIFWDAHGSTEYDTSVSKYSESKASADNLVLECNGSTKDSSTGFITYNYVPTNIWIDHCVFTDGNCSDLERNYNHDGSLDMKAGKNVTVSYCEFTNHDKVTLLAPSDSYVDPEQRQITFHHNYYHDAVQRMPRSRGCQLHIYNNYYNAIGTTNNGGYALGPGIGSQFIVEGNYFGSFQKTIVQYADSSASTSADTLSKFYQKNNSKTLTSSDVKFDSAEKVKNWSAHETSTAPWTITYSYTADSYSDLPSLIPASAGTDKSGYSKIINVNGTVYGE